MKSRRTLVWCLRIYLAIWLLSAICIRPGRIEDALARDIPRESKRYPQLQQSLCIAPALFIVDWNVGKEAFASAGYKGLVLYTPWGAYRIWQTTIWLS
jgi:hypothetical protein